MIQFKDVVFSYAQGQSFNFNIHIKQGERVVLLGSSGSGKSTFLNLLAGFLSPERGDIYLEGKRVNYLDPSQRPVSMLFQQNNLFDYLSVLENIALGVSGSLSLNIAQRKQVQYMLEKVGLVGFELRSPYELSGGQQQRVAIARTFLRPQPIILMDEPFSSLDESLRVEMKLLMNQLVQEDKRTLVMVSHHPKEVSDVIDRVFQVVEGQLVEI